MRDPEHAEAQELLKFLRTNFLVSLVADLQCL